MNQKEEKETPKKDKSIEEVESFHGMPLSIKELAVLMRVNPKTMGLWIKEDMEKLKKRGYREGRRRLPSKAVQLYLEDWLD